MKLLFIYLFLVLAISFYMWVHFFKEGNQDGDMEKINGLLTSKYEDTNILKNTNVTPGITSIDRYEDCSNNGYIYCVDGQIECQNIFGDVQNKLESGKPYEQGSTLKGCGSYINKINLNDYTTEIGLNIGTGVYFDLSHCNPKDAPGKPWRVGNTAPFQCFASQSDADQAWYEIIDISLNSNTIYKEKDDVFILASFVSLQTNTIQLLTILDENKNNFKTINNQKYYYGKLYSINVDKTYNVEMSYPAEPDGTPSKKQPIMISNVPKYKMLKNSLYNPKSNDYYSDLKSDSHLRPVCKSGAFTSCLSKFPYTIENGQYKSTAPEDNPFLLDGSYNQYRKQSQIDLDMSTPFSKPPINPSGLVDNSIDPILEYNYFKQSSDTPFIKCIADYGSNIGDPLCCNQKGNIKDTKYICPEEVPSCKGYSANDKVYGYCT